MPSALQPTRGPTTAASTIGAAPAYLWPGAVVLIAVAAMLWHGPIAQLADYHHFADARSWLGLPNAADVLSNLGFAVVGLIGLQRLAAARQRAVLGQAWPGYLLFFAALVLTALGSSWYHWAPDNARLVWDRLPIALACAGLMSAVGAETIGPARWMLPVLTACATASVAWWRYTDLHGLGDLRPYLLMQCLPLLLVPLLQWQHGTPAQQRRIFGAALACYVAAKALELADHAVYAGLGVVSGHTLKHVLATAAAGAVLLALRRRLQ